MNVYIKLHTPPLIRGDYGPAHAEHNKMMHGTYLGPEYGLRDLLPPPL